MSTLLTGSSGPQVIQLQTILVERGFLPGPPDGNFGPDTAAAVVAFQKSVGLGVDGKVGPDTAKALGLVAPAPLACLLPAVTVAMVSHMFPDTPSAHIEENLAAVLNALVEPQLASKPMILMALATIRAETEGFLPISEGQSTLNTSDGGHPFDKYDFRKDLGNLGPPDGERYRGRGFVQLTGRSNYDIHGRAIGMPQLLDNPDLANDPIIAGKLLASFIKSREIRIQNALAANDLGAARTLVNGGSNGIDRFKDAYNRGLSVIPDTISV